MVNFITEAFGSSHFCVSFSRPRKSERIERKFIPSKSESQAPVGTTVIEDDEDSIIEESEFSAKDFLDTKDAGIGVLEHPLDARHLDNQHPGQADFDLCTQCTKKRERARQQRRSFKNEVSSFYFH